MTCVCKQTAVLVVRINNIGNNNGVLTDFYPFFSHFTLPHTSVGLTGCITNAFSVLNILTHLTTILPFGSL